MPPYRFTNRADVEGEELDEESRLPHARSYGRRPFFIMFALTDVGVNTFGDVYLNLNRFSMALLMVAPMVILMLFFMGQMFEHKRLNTPIYAASIALFLAAFLAIRTQTFVGNTQFLRSMIPHHSIAIKTCQRSDITDPEIIQLCNGIVASQQSEITQMEAILERLK